jgi:hypothetical protein
MAISYCYSQFLSLQFQSLDKLLGICMSTKGTIATAVESLSINTLLEFYAACPGRTVAVSNSRMSWQVLHDAFKSCGTDFTIWALIVPKSGLTMSQDIRPLHSGPGLQAIKSLPALLMSSAKSKHPASASNFCDTKEKSERFQSKLKMTTANSV